MGIFDKIYKFMNRESKEEREEREQKELEADRALLIGNANVNRGYKSARGVPGENQRLNQMMDPNDIQNTKDITQKKPKALNIPRPNEQMAPMPSLG